MGKKHSQKVEAMTFKMTAAETAAAEVFCKEHIKHALHMSAGEAFQVIFTPTGIGDCVAVRCLTCGEVEDITDIDKF